MLTNGVPSTFNWIAGTLNITSSIVWDSGAASNTASDAFGATLALGTGQVLEITGNETLGGEAAFALTINPGGSHYVSGNLTISPTGVLTQNGGTLYAGTITMAFLSFPAAPSAAAQAMPTTSPAIPISPTPAPSPTAARSRLTPSPTPEPSLKMEL